jgi:hypothetical protein
MRRKQDKYVQQIIGKKDAIEDIVWINKKSFCHKIIIFIVFRTSYNSNF